MNLIVCTSLPETYMQLLCSSAVSLPWQDDVGVAEQPSDVMLLSAICEALPAVMTMEGAETGASGPGLRALLRLVMGSAASAGPAGALLLLRLPCILAPATDRMIKGSEVTAHLKILSSGCVGCLRRTTPHVTVRLTWQPSRAPCRTHWRLRILCRCCGIFVSS